ncbi:MAG: YafY family transcriptional regulator [Candidatus Zixiibacteriota bacterium]|nr:MAG: YafY family transcriptional regulator [candidate division Zixibacteria bacterium]
MGMAKYDRLLYILNLLRSRRNLNAGMIARECEVTERTIYRDIVALSEANVPIYYDRGYKFASENFLPPLNFTASEYVILKTALESTPLHRNARARQIIKSIRSKIESSLSSQVKNARLYTSDATRVEIKSTIPDGDAVGFYSAVEQAIKEHRVLILTYDSIESGQSMREVEPYFLIFIERAFYFIGFCRLRQALRTFRIDRVKDITVTGQRFKPRRDINPAGYFKDSWGVFSGEPVDVEIIFTGRAARVVRMGRHHPGEKVSALDENRLRYRVRVSGVEEISRWIMGFGGEATVIRPRELREEVAGQAKKILKNYKK